MNQRITLLRCLFLGAALAVGVLLGGARSATATVMGVIASAGENAWDDPLPLESNIVDSPSSTPVEGPITTNTTWDVAHSPYVMTADVMVNNGVTLTVEAGVVVQASGPGLIVHGALRAVGAAAQPIAFTTASATPEAGQWGGILFAPDSDDARSLLEYVSVGYAGAGIYVSGCGAYSVSAGIGICAAAPTIRRSAIHHNQGDGIWISGAGQVTAAPQLDANTFTANTGAAVHLPFTDGGGVLPTGAGNTATGNGFDGFAVDGTLAYATTLAPTLGLPLGVITNYLTVNQGVELTVAPGTSILNSLGLIVHGALRAVGAAAQPIAFTMASATPEAGQWGGIFFEADSDDARSLLEYVSVDYAGRGLWASCIPYSAAAITICDAAPTIRHTTVQHSIRDGILISGTDQLSAAPQLDSNTFTSNSGIAVHVQFDQSGNLLPTGTDNIASNNGFDGLAIGGTMAYSTTLAPALSLPLGIDGSLTVNHNAELPVVSGTTVYFGASASFYEGLYVHGALRAVGTVDHPIIFTPATASPHSGDWDGVVFEPDSDDARSILEYVSIGYAGVGIVIGDASPTIRHSTVHHSGNGVWITDARLTLTQNNFVGNEVGIHVQNSTVAVEDCNIHDNRQFGIQNESPSRPVSARFNWWGASDGPYHRETNPQGTGNQVSNDVVYDPWQTSLAGRQPVTLTLG